MTDIFNFIDELKELQHLYATGEICFMDFQEKIAQYEQQVEQFEEEFTE